MTLSSLPVVRIPELSNNKVNRSNFLASFWRFVVSLLSRLLDIFFSANNWRNYPLNKVNSREKIQAAVYPAIVVVGRRAGRERTVQSLRTRIGGTGIVLSVELSASLDHAT